MLEPGDKPQFSNSSALTLAFNADSITISAIDIGMKNREPVIFYAFRAVNLVAENTSHHNLRSADSDSASMNEKKTPPSIWSYSSGDRLTLGISAWMPDQHPATNATKTTVLRSIHENDYIKLNVNKTRTSHFRDFQFKMAVSPDANFVIAQHGTFLTRTLGEDGLVTLYRFIPNQYPRFLKIDLRENKFVTGMFHWTRDSRFCLWHSEHERNKICALELIRSSDETDVFKHHSLSLPYEHCCRMFINDVINSPDGRYLLIVRYKPWHPLGAIA